MTTQPTAAPWKVTIQPTHIPGTIRADIEPAEGPYRGSIAYLQSVDWDGGIGPDEMTANAHLLRAAPDMFAASPRAAEMLRIAAKVLRSSSDGELKHFYDEAECDGWCIADDCEAAADDIDAALAKARGQA